MPVGELGRRITGRARPRTIDGLRVLPKRMPAGFPSFSCLVSIPPECPATTRLSYQWGEPEGTGGIILTAGDIHRRGLVLLRRAVAAHA
jgi:hypothetical protein